MREASILWWQAAGLVFSGIAIISVLLASLMWLLNHLLHRKPNLFLVSSFVAVALYAFLYRSSTLSLLDTLPILETITLVLLAIGILLFITHLAQMVKRENDHLARRARPGLGQNANKGVN